MGGDDGPSAKDDRWPPGLTLTAVKFPDAHMTTLGTPLSPHATRVLLLGSGELGKEVAIELQRFGVEVIAADRYADAPAMQVAHRSHVLDMLDGAALRARVTTVPGTAAAQALAQTAFNRYDKAYGCYGEYTISRMCDRCYTVKRDMSALR